VVVSTGTGVKSLGSLTPFFNGPSSPPNSGFSDADVSWPSGGASSGCAVAAAVSQGFLRAGTVFGAESSVPRTMLGMVSMPGMGWLRVMRSTMWVKVVGYLGSGGGGSDGSGVVDWVGGGGGGGS